MKFRSSGLRDTAKFAQIILEKALKNIERRGNFVIGLEGDLGAGKTAFTKIFAKKMGINEPITSPTFTIMKRYEISGLDNLKNLYHIDAYRVAPVDFTNLGFKKILREKGSVVIVEWADQVKKVMPKDTFWIKIEHGPKIRGRIFNYETK